MTLCVRACVCVCSVRTSKRFCPPLPFRSLLNPTVKIIKKKQLFFLKKKSYPKPSGPRSVELILESLFFFLNLNLRCIIMIYTNTTWHWKCTVLTAVGRKSILFFIFFNGGQQYLLTGKSNLQFQKHAHKLPSCRNKNTQKNNQPFPFFVINLL